MLITLIKFLLLLPVAMFVIALCVRIILEIVLFLLELIPHQ